MDTDSKMDLAKSQSRTSPIVLGTILAILAAVAFGVTTPFIQRFGAGLGPFATAAILYLGAALGAMTLPRKNARTRSERKEAAVQLRHLPRLLVVALFGAVIAPTLFAWGLQRVPATYGSLLLNGEAIFTVLLAAIIYREHVGKPVAVGLILMFAGGAVTIVASSSKGSIGILGALAIVAAVSSWALDNVLTRPFADLDPNAVVRTKALCGVLVTGSLAVLFSENYPSRAQLLGLLASGAVGYGLSLKLYLLAQRRIGAGRTGSVFSVAPFVGVVTAIALGEKEIGLTTVIAAGLFIAGLIVHLTESHRHEHVHEKLAHEHAHSHDDGHHFHSHLTAEGEAQTGKHSHVHSHETSVHTHPHGPDAHHGHKH